jgi:hypothetical protein
MTQIFSEGTDLAVHSCVVGTEAKGYAEELCAIQKNPHTDFRQWADREFVATALRGVA